MICRDFGLTALVVLAVGIYGIKYATDKLPENQLESCPPIMKIAERDLSGTTKFKRYRNIYIQQSGEKCRI